MTNESNPRAIRAQDAAAEQAEKDGRFLYDEFMAAARACDVSQLCWFAPGKFCWASAIEGKISAPLPSIPTRKLQSFAEVMESALDLGDGPALAEVLQLLCEMACCTRQAEYIALDSQMLIRRMAESFATHNLRSE